MKLPGSLKPLLSSARAKRIYRLLRPGLAATLVLCAVSALLLIAVFTNGWEEKPLAYAAYPLSAWALTAAVLHLISSWSDLSARISQTRAVRILSDRERIQSVSVRAGLGVSLFYASFKLTTGCIYRSSWLIAVAIYYAVLALMRYFLLRHTGASPADARRVYRLTGALMVLLGLTMSGLAVQMVRDNQVYSYPGFIIYASAAYTFYSLITAVIQLIRRRQEPDPLRQAARMLSCAVALMALYALQAGLIDRFGAEEGETFRMTMNILTGAVACLTTMILGALMLLGIPNIRKNERTGAEYESSGTDRTV